MTTAPAPDPDLPCTLAEVVTHELVVKRSRFLAHLEPVRTPEEADDVVARLRKQHWDARHHCVALVLGTDAGVQRSTDDGEPSGTAGVPMLEVLRHRRTTDVVAVVTRWFGGVLLGAGGLVRAYSGSVAAALEEAERQGVVLDRRRLVEVALDVPHADAGRVENVLRDWAAHHDAVVEDTHYGSSARLRLLVPPSALDRLRDDVGAVGGGALRPEVGAQRVVDVRRSRTR
ncbi:putative YigZ family protein [Isoptericola jiangsuensis]|uniref:Putative YigZ family protein n=1 Tax=Isoptericola jiangsuensis TaxID=548579 RepID=A0A2A9EXY7_9MICO|nr:YigZ family protein [Isoptericola jiangsuensis]PFG43182.1 putative YigZ family protein [Isoptericola jiangsuensis]